MKLNTAQVEQALSQFNAEMLPDEHPARAQLNEMFGDHTFFLDGGGLSILEAVKSPDIASDAGEIVTLAHWSDPSFAQLRVHEPEHTGVIVNLDPRT